jgi:uncharacterized protein YxeA
MKTILALAALALSPTIASAGDIVQHMSCADAQSFVAHHHYYYKGTRTGDVVPMYPVFHEALSCNGGSNMGRMNYVYEATLDNDACFLGFRCGGK